MGPGALAQVLRSVKQYDHPNLIAGLNPADDAAVYRLRRREALVQTVDFFPPVVDDPYTFGAVAAANAMSDIFAMGGRVLLAVNIAAFPDDLPLDVLAAIMQGGADKVREAGGIVAGGHTVTDREPKYGLCVTGLVDPRRVLSKGGARPGDILALSKPLGTGVITTAHRGRAVRDEHLAAAIDSMLALNDVVARVAVSLGVRAATDITGFGLLGHAWEMCEASGVGMEIDASAVPLLPGAGLYAEAGWLPGGKDRNEQYLLARAGSEAPRVTVSPAVLPTLRDLLLDPETSGGLLVAVPARRMKRFAALCADAGRAIWPIGEVVAGGELTVR